MKMDVAVEIWLHAFSTSAVNEDELLASVPGHFTGEENYILLVPEIGGHAVA
jgi:hypothetical protein